MICCKCDNFSRARDVANQYREAVEEADKARTDLAKEYEEKFQMESRLKAVTMQLNSANKQIEVT